MIFFVGIKKIMAEKTSRGRNQDRSKVAGSQAHEVNTKVVRQVQQRKK